MLLHLGRFLWIRRDVIEFDKRRILALYVNNDPPFIHPEALSLVERTLVGMELSKRDEGTLRTFAQNLRAEMNGLLGTYV